MIWIKDLKKGSFLAKYCECIKWENVNFRLQRLEVEKYLISIQLSLMLKDLTQFLKPFFQKMLWNCQPSCLLSLLPLRHCLSLWIWNLISLRHLIFMTVTFPTGFTLVSVICTHFVRSTSCSSDGTQRTED